MKKILIFLLLWLPILSVPSASHAADCSSEINASVSSQTEYEFNSNRSSIVVNVNGLASNREFRITATGVEGNETSNDGSFVSGSGSFVFNDPWVRGNTLTETNMSLTLYENRSGIDYICDLEGITISRGEDSCSLNLSLETQGDECFISATASNITNGGTPMSSGTVNFAGAGGSQDAAVSGGSATATLGPASVGSKRVVVQGTSGDNLCEETIDVDYSCSGETSNTGEDSEGQPLVQQTVDICRFADPEDMGACQACSGEGSNSVWTGLGCFSSDLNIFMSDIFKIAISLGGGISFLLLIYGAFLLTTSAGDPKNAENARGVITGAITGLLVIIFSAVILQIVGIEILQIPGF